MSYLHGAEIIEKLGIQTFAESDTAIPAIVGIAEKGRANEVVLITSLEDAKTEFGRNLEGTTIMSALAEILSDKRVPVLVVNVASGAKLANMIDSPSNLVKLTGNGELVTQVHKDTIASTTGLVNFQTELIAGLEILKTAVSNFGLMPNFIIVPGFSQVQNIFVKMREMATFFKGKAIVDIYATSVNDATIKRNTLYDFSDKRVVLTFPNVFQFSQDAGKDVEIPLSQIWVNETIKTHIDKNKGFWRSPSNVELIKVKKPKVPMVFSITDSTADNQVLNSKGIVTIVKTKGSNFRLSGNWTSAFPVDQNHRSQIAPSIVKDAIEETIQRESYKFADQNIDYATLDLIVASVMQYLYKLKGKGAIIDGNISYSQEKNPLAQVSAGQFVFDFDYCEVPTLDRITYEAFQDLEMLKSLFKN